MVAQVSGDFFEGGEGATDVFLRWKRDINKNLRPIAAEIGNLADETIRNGDEGASGISNHRSAQGEIFDAAEFGINLDEIAHDELVLEDDEETVDKIFHQVLGAETKGEAGDSRGRFDRRHVEAKFGKCS